jgi:site-specific DNA recombinase
MANAMALSLRGGIIMARKSRKHPDIADFVKQNRETVGYICLSVRNTDASNSIENQKLLIEDWGCQHQIPIMRYYIDNGFSGRRFDRPAFQQMIHDIRDRKLECIVVKDLSRLGRDYLTVGYYLEKFFPVQRVRFVSINDQFDTTDGITNRNEEVPAQFSIRIPLIIFFNEQVSIETKINVKESLDMKAQRGEFIGPRAPFGYQKFSENHNQLVPDPVSGNVVRKIFVMAASGTGVTGIVRYLNEHNFPTPIQYARSNGLIGNYDDGNGSWNSRSVKYILTNRTYTGMLIQGKEKRAVEATHKPLVETAMFDAIQKSFQKKAYDITPKELATENILKGKVICGCCGSKMQRRRGTGHADWYFFTCITKNRLGTGKCTGMYVREEDVFKAIYRQLKIYVDEHFITDSQHRQRIRDYNKQINQLAKNCETAWANAKKYFEKYMQDKVSKEEFCAAQEAANQAKEALVKITESKAAYETQYKAFRRLLSASRKEIPLSEVMDYIEKITVDKGGKIMVK